MIINSSTHGLIETPRKPGRDDPDPRPSAPPPPDLPDRADPPEPINFPSPPDADDRDRQRQPISHPADVLRAIALLEEQAVQLRHFTVLDTILRLKRRFNARPPMGAA
jgi:hypothetical protein